MDALLFQVFIAFTRLIDMKNLVLLNRIHTLHALPHRPYHGIRFVLLNHNLTIVFFQFAVVHNFRAFQVAFIYHDVIFVEGADGCWLHLGCLLDLLVLDIENMSDTTSYIYVFILLNRRSTLLLWLLLVTLLLFFLLYLLSLFRTFLMTHIGFLNIDDFTGLRIMLILFIDRASCSF